MDDFDEWLEKRKEYVEYTYCVFYDKIPQETAYCDYKQEYLDNGCEKGCEHCRRIEEIRKMVEGQEHE